MDAVARSVRTLFITKLDFGVGTRDSGAGSRESEEGSREAESQRWRLEFQVPHGILYLVTRHELCALGRKLAFAAGVPHYPDPSYRRHGNRGRHMRGDRPAAPRR